MFFSPNKIWKKFYMVMLVMNVIAFMFFANFAPYKEAIWICLLGAGWSAIGWLLNDKFGKEK